MEGDTDEAGALSPDFSESELMAARKKINKSTTGNTTCDIINARSQARGCAFSYERLQKSPQNEGAYALTNKADSKGTGTHHNHHGIHIDIASSRGTPPLPQFLHLTLSWLISTQNPCRPRVDRQGKFV